ncbi:TonB-dependent receptor [Chitinophagaceae bacterium 26-R-25]|nr:TonB-dependent receptor [Chitinophagaceae bacterium 26-R-25]
MKITRRIRPAILLPALLCCVILTSAQQKISGRVTDESGNPLSGVTISIKGKNIAVVTDAKGNYTIPAADDDELIFTYIGFAKVEQKAASSTLNVKLATDKQNLNEVVVVGYGTTRKKDLTGSISTVTAKDFQKGQISTPEQMIAGKVAGVSVISNSGQPGAGSTIRIRGGSSVNASNDPLFVVDGVPLENSSISGASNPLSFINSNDIESFTVLKDASAAAIYGTRAANGVILITTKKGVGGRLKVNFTTNNSLSRAANKVDVLSADEFRTVVNAKGTATQKAALGTANTNWQDEIYQTAFSTDNNISISGGIKKLPYRLSIGYLNQSGILKTDNLQRTSATLRINPSFFDDHLKVDLNLKGSFQNTRFANTAAIGSAVTFDPSQPIYSTVKDGRYGGYWEYRDPTSPTGLSPLAGRNPVGLLNQRIDKSNPVRGIGNLQLDYKFHFLPDLHANMNLGYDVVDGKGTVFVSDSAASDYAAGGTGGQNNKYRQTQKNTVFDFYLNYSKDIPSIKSHVDAMAGYSYVDYLTKVYNYASYNAAGVKYPNSDPAFPYNEPEHSLVSFFGRVNYSYADRYLLTGTLRRDGSSRFGPLNKWAMFPSVAFAWKIKNEQFLMTNNTISDLKLRIGYGITGQQDGIDNYAFLAAYGLSSSNASYPFGSTYYQMYRPGAYNPAIKWEQTATSNIALDYGFLNNRITGSIDLYYKKTSDLLVKVPQPAGSNFAAYFLANIGDMTNKGVEFSVNAQIVKTKDFTWDAGFNIAYNKNKITNLSVIPGTPATDIPTGGIAGGKGGYAQVFAVGYPRNTFNLYEQVYDSAGKPLENVVVDVNKDGIINEKDLVKSKSSNPDVFMGFTTNFSYKKWNAGFVLRSSIGNYVYNNIASNNGNRNQILGNPVLYNASRSYLDTKFVGSNVDLLSDYFMQNASFLRMDNFTVGYNAGAVFKKKANLRLNAGVQNVFVITKYKGIDPEISSGIDNNMYPRPRIFTLGGAIDF